MAASHKLARASMRALYARPLFMQPTRFLSTTQTLWATEKPTLPAEPLPDAATQAPDLSFPTTDWSTSFSGLSHTPFKKEIADILLAPLDHGDIEIKPDGIMYLPEIKYRRVLNKAFGPGGWGLAPRSDTRVEGKQVSREYALICLGRLVAVARGEQDFFDPSGIATATEGCKSNALMRCCKDLGIGSELWDPRFIRQWKAKYAVNVFATNSSNNQKKKLWRRKDDPPFSFPWTESPAGR